MKELMNKVKELPLEKRVEVIAKVISRLSVRLHKTTSAIISPIPIMVYSQGEDIRGDIFKGMLFRGKLSKLVIAFDKKPKSPVSIELKSMDMEGGESTTIFTDVRLSSHNIDLVTDDGSMLVVTVNPTGDEQIINEISLSLLWTPHTSNTKVKQHLIDDLVGGIDEGI
jgi:hypothetical protein